MILTIGRIIHVIDSSIVDSCIAAIVTELDYRRGMSSAMHVTIFPPFGSSDGAARRIVLALDSLHWHDPRECPLAPLWTNAGGGGSSDIDRVRVVWPNAGGGGSGGVDRVRVAPDHPQDGYAYDGCTCDRCIAIRGAGEA